MAVGSFKVCLVYLSFLVRYRFQTAHGRSNDNGDKTKEESIILV